MTTIRTSATTARLQVRISTELHAQLKRAAKLRGRTMTDFVVAAVEHAAQQAIQQSSLIQLSVRDQELFAQALLEPARPTPTLKRAFKRRRDLGRAE